MAAEHAALGQGGTGRLGPPDADGAVSAPAREARPVQRGEGQHAVLVALAALVAVTLSESDLPDGFKEVASRGTGRRFNRKLFGLYLRLNFDSETCEKYPFLNIFLV